MKDIKIYQVSDADWLATDLSKEKTAEWYDSTFNYGIPDGDVVWFLKDWIEIDAKTQHIRDVFEHDPNNPNMCSMQETIDEHLASGGTFPVLVSTSEW